ncbi:MAG: hypothetical protein R3Y54_08120 [Eubacteriales bacterium]
MELNASDYIGLIGIIVAIIGIVSNKPIGKNTRKYGNLKSQSSFEFDYTNNNGHYKIGDGEYAFTTKWTSASDKSIRAYNDGKDIDSIAY